MTPATRDALLADLLRITWVTMKGAQSHFATGTDRARRYAAGFSPLLGFADPARPAFDDLLPLCAPGEHFYTDGWSGAAPPGWQVDVEATMFKMVWEGGTPADDAAPDAVRLGPPHVDEAVALAALARPGPFGPRTIELGEYWGIVDDGRLVAMAGERMTAAPLREISGVCTHPGHQGRGLAKRLMLKLVARQLARGERPFLHVMRDNAGARGLYERMGFRVWAESVVRVVSRA